MFKTDKKVAQGKETENTGDDKMKRRPMCMLGPLFQVLHMGTGKQIKSNCYMKKSWPTRRGGEIASHMAGRPDKKAL